MEEPTIAQKAPYAVELKEGTTYAWCSCGLSKNQPFCDGAHKATTFKPHIFKAEKDETAYLCGCKFSGNGHFCDGKHKSL